jgi:GTP pyrophosphokinase
MVLAMVDDIRVVLIKLADRLHNMRTLTHLAADRQQQIATETLDIYAPIAHRLGMGKVRGELEDLAFRYVDPIGYKQVHDAVESRRKRGEQFLQQIEAVIREKLKENGVEAKVEHRIKRLYSVHQKLLRQRISVDQVYDLLAIRIIAGSVRDCYAALGAIHNLWRPVAGRIKDFIAMPRPNFYQSLHTTVIAENGMPFEVQIRTEEMHKMAEDGIAAHWKYKDGAPVTAKDEERLAWLRQVVEWQQEVHDPNEFLSSLKIDLYPEEVYVFTPKGKIVILPREATPVDFAYAIHTEVGERCVGAKVNGRMVPLRTKLRSGDIVEILTAPNHHPIHQRERAIEIGRKLVEREAKKYRIALKDLTEPELQRVAGEYGLGRPDDLFANIGFGKFSARHVLAKLLPSKSRDEQSEQESDRGESGFTSVVRRVFGSGPEPALLVKGHDDLLTYRARCCNPIRGEEIIGYVTRGKGVAVHSKNCPNVTNLMYEADRRILVDWAKPVKAAPAESALYPVKLTVYCDDRWGMLKQITATISDAETNIRNIEARTSNGQATIDAIVDIEDVKHLHRIVSGLRKIPGVRDVQRVQRV